MVSQHRVQIGSEYLFSVISRRLSEVQEKSNRRVKFLEDQLRASTDRYQGYQSAQLELSQLGDGSEQLDRSAPCEFLLITRKLIRIFKDILRPYLEFCFSFLLCCKKKGILLDMFIDMFGERSSVYPLLLKVTAFRSTLNKIALTLFVA